MIIAIEKLSWNQRFALIDYFKLSDADACLRLRFTPGELKGAKDLQKGGLFRPDPMLNCEAYRPLLAPEEVEKPKKKRGRNTTKIKDAYEAIPYEKTPVEEFMAKHNISLSVLRRHKQYDHRPELGRVRVEKTVLVRGEEKILCVWREKKPDE